MIMKEKAWKKTASLPASLCLGMAASVLLTLLSAVVITFMVAGEQIEESAVTHGAALTMLIASAVGAFVASCGAQEKLLWRCLLVGGVYLLCVLLLNAIAFGASFGNLTAGILAVIAGCGTVALLRLRGSGGGRRKRFSYRPR